MIDSLLITAASSKQGRAGFRKAASPRVWERILSYKAQNR